MAFPCSVGDLWPWSLGSLNNPCLSLCFLSNKAQIQLTQIYGCISDNFFSRTRTLRSQQMPNCKEISTDWFDLATGAYWSGEEVPRWVKGLQEGTKPTPLTCWETLATNSMTTNNWVLWQLLKVPNLGEDITMKLQQHSSPGLSTLRQEPSLHDSGTSTCATNRELTVRIGVYPHSHLIPSMLWPQFITTISWSHKVLELVREYRAMPNFSCV